MAYLEFDGSGEAEARMDSVMDALESLLSADSSATLDELFPDDFMVENTCFGSVQEFFAAGRFDISSQEAFLSLPPGLLDAHVADTTNFDSWASMLLSAQRQFAARRLNT